MVKFYGRSVSLSALRVTKNESLSDFYVSSWQRGDSAVPMLVVRMLLNGLALSIFLWAIVEAKSFHWLIYLTNWGVLLLVGTTTSGLAISCICFWKKPTETEELPWYMSLYWVFFNMSVTISVMITVLYWTLLYEPAQREKLGTRLFMLDVTKHGITSCILLAELFLSRTPIWFAHIFQPLGVAVTYLIFSIIYYAAGGTDNHGNKYVYSVLDWQHTQRTILVVLGSIVGLIVLYVLLWIVALNRNNLSKALVRIPSYDDSKAPDQLKKQVV